ncbi:MAG: hypothetical protein AAFP93_01575, partial [Bacteroidota bacterium]
GATGISPLIRKLHQLGEGINRKDVQSAIIKLNKILTHVERMLSQANEKDSGDALYGSLNKVLTDLDHLLVDLQTYPERYMSFSIFGGKMRNQSHKK